MSNYFSTDSIIIQSSNEAIINDNYSHGYLFTRKAKGNLYQTRSLRINLKGFKLSSENRRVLSKNQSLKLKVEELPLKNYSWTIHQFGKEFYSIKFGEYTMSASKIKEMFTDMSKSNMNYAFIYSEDDSVLGYCLAYINNNIVHYAYPFYILTYPKGKNLGMAMMLNAIIWAKENNKEYIYLGSVTDEKAKYKLQFEGEEWFDEIKKEWSKDLKTLKNKIYQASASTGTV